MRNETHQRNRLFGEKKHLFEPFHSNSFEKYKITVIRNKFSILLTLRGLLHFLGKKIIIEDRNLKVSI